MSKTTLTFELGGQVELKDLEKGITLFTRLVSNLTLRSGVTWIVEDLQPGSATVTLRGEADDPAKVVGRVSREPVTGKPISIRDIRQVKLLDDVAPGTYRQAGGAVPWEPGDMMPEEAIRLLRDA